MFKIFLNLFSLLSVVTCSCVSSATSNALLTAFLASYPVNLDNNIDWTSDVIEREFSHSLGEYVVKEFKPPALILLISNLKYDIDAQGLLISQVKENKNNLKALDTFFKSGKLKSQFVNEVYLSEIANKILAFPSRVEGETAMKESIMNFSQEVQSGYSFELCVQYSGFQYLTFEKKLKEFQPLNPNDMF